MSLAYGEQQQRPGSALGASGSRSQYDLETQFQVVLQDTLGHPSLGFRDGTWYRLTVSGPQALQLRGAIRTCPHAAGSIVQIACWWMRENPTQDRALDLATELALTVGELVRACPADGLGSTSMDLLPAAMAAVAPSPAAALPVGAGSGYSSASSSDGMYGAAGGYSSAGSASEYTPTSDASNWYSSAGGSTGGYGSSNGYGDAYGTTNGYGSASDSANGYGTGSYAAAPDTSQSTYAATAQSTYAAASAASQSPYAAASSYAPGSSYDAAQTSYLPATTSASAAAAHGWFEPADGTGTGGFPKVPPAPVVGRQAAPSAAAPAAPKPYPPARAQPSRGYNGAAQPQAQAALPAAAPTRGYSETADWEPRPVAPRQPSYQPHPQQAAPRPVPAASGQAPRPRPQPPREDFERRLGMTEPPDLSRSSDRDNGVPPRRPSAAQGQQRGTMGQRPASRPRRPA